MSLNESIVEDASLEWFGEQTRFARTLTPALSHVERERREAIRRLNPANACGNPHQTFASGYLRYAPVPKGRGVEARATIRQFRIVQIGRRLNP